MWRKSFAGFVILFLLVVALMYSSGAEKQVGKKSSEPERYVAAEGRIGVKPNRRALLAAEVSARIEEIHVDNLSPVRKGELLAVLYNRDLAEKIRQTEKSFEKAKLTYAELANGSRKEDVQAAEAEVRRAEAALELAIKNEQRDRNLWEQGVVANSRYDATMAERKMAESQWNAVKERLERIRFGERKEVVEAARAEMESQRYSIESLKAAYQKTYISSPLDGIVIRRYKNASEFAQEGEPILEVADLSDLMVNAEVNEMDAGKIRNGMRVAVTSDAFPGHSFWGQVYEVSEALAERGGDPDDPAVIVDQKILPVKVRFEKTVPLKLGMKVHLKIM